MLLLNHSNRKVLLPPNRPNRLFCLAPDFILLLLIILWHHVMLWYLQLRDSKLTIESSKRHWTADLA